jgi:hypothetical protein
VIVERNPRESGVTQPDKDSLRSRVTNNHTCPTDQFMVFQPSLCVQAAMLMVSMRPWSGLRG